VSPTPRNLTRSLLTALGVAGMIAAIGYGAVQVRTLDAEYQLRADSLIVLSGLADSLRREVNEIRTRPLSELITPRVVAVPASRVRCPEAWDGYGRDQHGLCPGYGFLLWLDLPYARRTEIREAAYHFDGLTTSPIRTGREPSNGFLVGWLGWWPWPTIPIVVSPKVGPKFTFDFPMEQAMRDAGWTEGK
jgi:hypothetical protein